MPFIKQSRRNTIKRSGLDGLKNRAKGSWIEPGDLCYVHYKNMMDIWRENPKWTTAHEIYKEWFTKTDPDFDDDAVAARLAWEVFFALHVLEYEKRKREENGDI